jgi:hypothetical protein
MPPSNYGHSDIPNFVTMGCEAQFQTGFLGFVTGIRDRRYPVIDEERQAVLAFAFFDHDGSIRSIPLSTGQTFTVPPYFSTPRTLIIAEGFKVVDSKLRLIEAALSESPYGMKSVLDDAPPPSPRRPPSHYYPGGLPRSPLGDVLVAMLARDPSEAPLASDVRYTENGPALPVGEGLWRTLTALGPYRVDLASAPERDGDPALFYGIVETDIPGQLALRVRQTSDGRISEIEALIVRQEVAMLGKLIGTDTLFAPPQLADFDATRFKAPAPVLVAPLDQSSRTPVSQLRSIATAYAGALYGGGSAARLFAERCTARENGVTAVLNSAVKPLPGSKPAFHPFQDGCAERVERGFFARVGRLREARVLAADEASGLVLLSTTVDHPGDIRTVTLADGTSLPVPAPFMVPNTYFGATLLKVSGGRIEHVEAISRPVFFGLDDGWRD